MKRLLLAVLIGFPLIACNADEAQAAPDITPISNLGSILEEIITDEQRACFDAFNCPRRYVDNRTGEWASSEEEQNAAIECTNRAMEACNIRPAIISGPTPIFD